MRLPASATYVHINQVGYNSVTDFWSEAQLMREVCRDVQLEPTLLQISEHKFNKKANSLPLTMQIYIFLLESSLVAVYE